MGVWNCLELVFFCVVPIAIGLFPYSRSHKFGKGNVDKLSGDA